MATYVINRETNLIISTDPFEQYYRKEETQLGNGMNGGVYLCTNRRDNKKYAVKTIRYNGKNEIELHFAHSLQCKQILKIKDAFVEEIKDNNRYHVVFELMEGGSLSDLISRRRAAKKPLTEKEVASIIREVALAIGFLHKGGYAHRDIKPDNILLSSKNDNADIKLGDFGFVENDLNGLTTRCYTRLYAAPEIIKEEHKNEPYDKACDMWSLGVVMFFLCSGRFPTDSEPDSFKNTNPNFKFSGLEWKNVSSLAQTLIARMLTTERKKRLTIDELLGSEWITTYTNTTPTCRLGLQLPIVDLCHIEKECPTFVRRYLWPTSNVATATALKPPKINKSETSLTKSVSQTNSKNTNKGKENQEPSPGTHLRKRIVA